MQIGYIKNATRIVGKSQGYMRLPLRDEIVNGSTPAMVSAWLPTPKELEALNAGAAVHVHIMGNIHPSIIVNVGEIPE